MDEPQCSLDVVATDPPAVVVPHHTPDAAAIDPPADVVPYHTAVVPHHAATTTTDAGVPPPVVATSHESSTTTAASSTTVGRRRRRALSPSRRSQGPEHSTVAADTDAATAAPPLKRRNTGTNPPNRIRRVVQGAAAQAEQDTTLPDRLRQHLHGTRLRTVPYVLREGPAQDILEFAEHLVPNEQRSLCDCFRCVQHALNVAGTDYSYRAPQRLPPPDVKYVHLPGLAVNSSSMSQRRALSRHLLRSPEKITYACSCQYCVVHRCHVRTFGLVNELPPPTSEVEAYDPYERRF